MAVTLPPDDYIINSTRTNGEMKTSLEQIRDAVDTIDSTVDQNVSDISDLQIDVAALSGLTTATETTEGIVELATVAEVITGTDTGRVVTPAGLAGLTATDSRNGLIELATGAEVITGTDTSRAITPAGLAGLTATDSRNGLVELATNGETQTGTDTSRAITPANLQACTATETRSGVIELATQSEVDTGTDTSRAITPATLAGKIVSATTTTEGLIEIATQTETNNGISGTIAVTPATLLSKLGTLEGSWITPTFLNSWTGTIQYKIRYETDGFTAKSIVFRGYAYMASATAQTVFNISAPLTTNLRHFVVSGSTTDVFRTTTLYSSGNVVINSYSLDTGYYDFNAEVFLD